MEKQNRIRAFLSQVSSGAGGQASPSFELLHSDLPPMQNPWITPQQETMESIFAHYDDFGVGLPPSAVESY